MSPRRSVVEARQTRTAIVARATDLASREGLEGLTIGRLATDLGMSKAGVIGHFGSKEALQLAAVEEAGAAFRRDVWEAAQAQPPGLRRLRALADAWIASIAEPAFSGGCFWTAAAAEWDSRGGPVREAIAEWLGRWYGALRREAQIAIDAGELPPDADPAQIVFELKAAAMAVNQERQLEGDDEALAHARRAVERILTARPT